MKRCKQKTVLPDRSSLIALSCREVLSPRFSLLLVPCGWSVINSNSWQKRVCYLDNFLKYFIFNSKIKCFIPYLKCLEHFTLLNTLEINYNPFAAW